MAKSTIRIFISSPADVRPERLLAERIVARLDREFGYHVHVEAVLWEREPLVATHHFQDPRNIPVPHESDVVVVILWSRLGLLLPEDAYRGAISGRAVTGTEWEFEDALKAARERGVPELMLYRKSKPISVLLDDDAELERRREQKRLVEDFIGRWFGGADGGRIIAASQSFETAQEFEEKLYEHLRAILERRVGGEDLSVAIRWHEPPFRGLLSFEVEHAPVFFGRTRARNEVRELLAAQAASGRAFVLVLGASGSGKSSLVKAGVVPDLMLPGMVGHVALCRYAIARPSDNPADVTGTLAAAILSDTALPELKALRYTLERLAAALRDAPQQATVAVEQGLAEAGKAAGLTEIAEARLILIVDQFEELFTIGTLDDAARSQFVRALEALARSGLAWVIATMRSDFFDRLESFPELARLAERDARYLLLPATDTELGQIIREPAREAGLRFEVDPTDGTPLDDRIREAARDRDALPLLSFVLDELWRQRTDRGVLTFDAYRSLGGLEGALARRADVEFDAQPDDARAALPRVLRALVTIGREGQIVARAALLARFPYGSPQRRLIDAFASSDARLFVVAADPAGGEPRVRVAHEALLTHWARAKQCIEENRASLQLEARISDEASRWRSAAEKDRASLLLARGLPLEEAMDLMRRRGDELPAELRDFIERSHDAAKAATRRRRFVLATAMLVLAVLTTVSTGALYLANRARNDALVAQSRFLARDARAAVDQGDAVLGMLLALEALPKEIAHPDRPFVNEAEHALERAAAAQTERKVLLGHEGVVYSAGFSADGTRIVSASADKTVRIWDAASGAPLAVLRGNTGEVFFAAFSPEGKRVVSASLDKTVRIWNATNGTQIAELRGHTAAVYSAAFSPDGKRVVSASDDKTVRIWDAASGAQIAVLRGHEGSVWSAAFSPDGKRIVSASSDKFVRTWDAASGKQTAVLRGHEGWVYSAAFSRDGKRIVTASDDKTLRIWNAVSGAQIAALRGHGSAVTSAAFSSDGKRIVSTSGDKTLRIWDATLGTQIAVLSGHESAVYSAMFSPDGQHVVSAALDKTVRIWDATKAAQLAVLRGHESLVDSVAFSPDGKNIVSASSDKTVRTWDATRGTQIAVLRGNGGSVGSAVFSPDGKRIVAAEEDRTARIWDVARGTQLTVLRGHEGTVHCATFSPDGNRIVSASDDTTLRIWDAASGGRVAVLHGHDGPVYFAAFSPDGKRIVSASRDKTVRIWDAASGAQIAVLHGHDDPVLSASFSPDGKRIVSASMDKTVRLWDSAAGAQIAVLRGHGDWVLSASFSPDGSRIVSASVDKTVRIWDTASGELIDVLRGHDGWVYSAAFSPDGKRVVSGSIDKTVRVWTVPLSDMRGQALIDAARKAVPRRLSDAQRAQEFLGSSSR